MRSNASSAAIRLPHEPCISRPSRRASSRSREPRLNGARPIEHDGHEELRVEPEPDLLAHLRDPVRREPLLPVGVIGQVGAVSPRAAPVALPSGIHSGFCQPSVEKGTMPASSQTSPTSAIRSTARRTARSGSARGRSTGGGAPRAGRALDRTFLELGARPDDVQVAAPARVEGQRQAVVAAPGDVPVAHVAQPVVHALAHVLRASTRQSSSPRASAAGARRTEMNQSSAMRKISGVWQRQHSG